jgi:hypothetical protein
MRPVASKNAQANSPSSGVEATVAGQAACNRHGAFADHIWHIKNCEIRTEIQLQNKD